MFPLSYAQFKKFRLTKRSSKLPRATHPPKCLRLCFGLRSYWLDHRLHNLVHNFKLASGSLFGLLKKLPKHMAHRSENKRYGQRSKFSLTMLLKTRGY